MACKFEITMPAGERANIEAARAALDEIDVLEAQLTVFRDSSELSFINRTAAAKPVSVEPKLFELLQLCKELQRETKGAFDATSGPLTRVWGFFKREGRVPDAQEIERARAAVGSQLVKLDSQSRTVHFDREGVEINLGSIGKGYALDHVAAKLRRRRADAALLSAGYSSMLALGRGASRQRGWVVGVRHPRKKEKRLALLQLRDCAMSTSGSEEQFFEHDGRRFGHIIDPRTGYPTDAVSGVTVVAQSAAASDALATAFFVGGRELAEAYCAAHSHVLVIMLLKDESRPTIIGSNENCEVELVDE
jgi:thiamine biosynthesis lipoprotein